MDERTTQGGERRPVWLGHWIPMGWLNVILLSVLGLLQYRLWFGDGGIGEIGRLQQALEAQQSEHALLRARNAQLAAEVKDLKEGLEVIEGLARRELGMIGEGETFYQFLDE